MKRRFLTLLVLPMTLTSCTNGLSLEFVPFSKYEAEQKMMRNIDNEYFYSLEKTTPVSYNEGTIDNPYELLSLNKTGIKRVSIPTTGERKLLVVPVYFSDSDISNQDKKTIYIQNAFFGETKRTEYDSVAGYYNKSSYGQLKITGEVAPWFNIGISSDQWKTLSSSHSNASSIIAARAVDYIKENNLLDLSKYDTDGDDNIDGVYVIYDHPLDNKNSSDTLFWAYTYYTYEGENGLNKTAPFLNDYAWTSVNAITDVGTAKDNKAYTNYLIHETGHLFGLSDYYNIYYSGGSNFHYQPTGSFDMMDYNVGDHSVFSKYLLKWASPLVVKPNKSFTYKLKPFQTSGEYFLIPSSNYADSPYGEYLLVEYFTPQGLNQYSKQFEYVSADGTKTIYRYPQYYGLKIYHVNASLGYFKQGVGKSTCICPLNDSNYEEKIKGQKVSVDYIYDNSITDDLASKDYPVLYHLLESSGENTFKFALPATKDTLFRVGDDFGITKFTDFKFSNGETTNFKLKVKAISSDYITLDITF